MATVDISAGLLPPPACYPSEQDRLDAYAAALIGNLTTGAEWATSQTAPGNPGLYWLRTDTSNRPIDVMRFSSAAGDSDFIRLSSEVVFAGTASGASGTYAVTNSPPYPSAASAYRTGQIYTFLANHTNPGASTLNVDGKGAKAITKDGAAALSANDILVGQVVSVLYDGVNFQLITQKRDLTRKSLKQFFYKETATQAVPYDGTRLDFDHGFVNPLTAQGIIPCMVRVVMKRLATGTASWTSTTGNGSFIWYEGQEVEIGQFVHYDGGLQDAMRNFLVTADSSQVHVYCNYPTYKIAPSPGDTSVANDLFPTGFFISAIFVPADYGIKVYAMAPNPEYVEP
jgi:hypothetical protein